MGKAKKFLRVPKHGMDFAFLRDVKAKVDALLNGKIVDENGQIAGDISYADGNTVFRFNGSNSAGTAISAFAITTLGDSDFFTARKLSNFRLETGVATADVGAMDIKIAKIREMRRSITSEVSDGITLTYTNTGADHDNNRDADDGGPDSPESQCAYPRYQTLATRGFTITVPMKEKCVIYAEQIGNACGVFDADGKALEWLEQPGRIWAKRFAP